MIKILQHILLLSGVLFSFPDCEFGDPNWEDDFVANDYEFDATLSVATITIDSADQSTGKLAAFVGDEIRGVDSDGGSPSPFGGHYYEVSIWSNSASDETVTFKFYDDANDVVIDLNETYDFISNEIIGNLYVPFVLTGTALDCECDDVDADDICDDIDDCVGDYDECDVCNGAGASYECLDGTMVCHSSDCTDSQFPNPDLFNFVSSTGLAYYYITNAYINGINLDDDDWIGAFKGDVCVGARQWDTDMCGNNVCDIALMGVNTLDDDTSEYMQNGDIPLFKIYDISENTYYNAMPSNNYEWESGGIFVIDNLNESDYYCGDTPSCSGCFDETACNYNSDALISDTCYYLDIQLLSPSDNQVLELNDIDNSLTFSWSEIHESCADEINYQIEIYNQSFDLLFSESTISTNIEVPYALLNIDSNELNLYSWFVSSDNLITSDTYYFTIDPTAMSLDGIDYSFDLFDNYPNPFNPITEIGFAISYHSFVNINIYDISGNFIEKLTENYYSPGSYKVYWDASNFSSGIYIYEMQTDNYLLSKKMILVK